MGFAGSARWCWFRRRITGRPSSKSSRASPVFPLPRLRRWRVSSSSNRWWRSCTRPGSLPPRWRPSSPSAPTPSIRWLPAPRNASCRSWTIRQRRPSFRSSIQGSVAPSPLNDHSIDCWCCAGRQPSRLPASSLSSTTSFRCYPAACGVSYRRGPSRRRPHHRACRRPARKSLASIPNHCTAPAIPPPSLPSLPPSLPTLKP